MKVLVCGGRNYADAGRLFALLDDLHRERSIVEVIEGGAHGADRIGHMWAKTRKVKNRRFFAAWAKYGNAAGPIRNQKMVDDGKPDLVIAAPGGAGTADMVRRARAAGIEVIEVPAPSILSK